MPELAPIPKDDAALQEALAAAHVPSLMAALVHITGDAQLIRGDIRPKNDFLADAQGGISEAQQASIRALAFEALRRFRDSGQRLPPAPSQSLVGEIVSFMIGQPVAAGYAEFLTSELALENEDPYAVPGLEALPAAQRAAFRVVIVGAGMSGLLAGIRLAQAGIPFTIVERHSDVGGTWWQNTYPGCRVDSPNHIYSYSFEPADWPQYYSPQRVLQRYFAHCADKYGLRPHIRFDTEVKEAVFDESSSTWRVEVVGKDGRAETLRANALISAVGQLNRPKWPELPGRERFRGISFHSAQWEHQHDLTGKRVIVIGTGASAFQFIPEIAKRAARVTVFQRTPPWVLPTPEYHDEVPAGKHWLLNHVPFYAKWYRFAMFWRAAEGILAAVEKDDAWPHPQRAVSPANDELRVMLTQSMTEIVGADSPLLEKIIPSYPVAGKRILLDNGNYLRALMRPNVELVTDPIREITETGVTTAAGQRYDADVLIYGTGFHASRFLWPMKIVGRGGVDLQQHWAGDPRAYLGITIPGFPNLFCCYGPNTNIVVNGSIIFFSECEVRYILGCVKLLLERGQAALDCKRSVHDAYNRRIDAGNLRMAWGAADVPTWYKNDKGRVTQNWPFTLVEFWSQTRTPNPADYEFLSA
ncbi:MAG TPA: NAD(P)/FAD-dependent oxidoreductase [Myxococcota bacterium]|nr:NAD(P)/FAD-dependent oxidoreductase [Myxococcota bacterium]